MSILSLHKKEAGIERRGTGIPGLDELLNGGFPNHSGIILRGPSGCGKSLFCKQFIWNGLNNGEFGLYITFDQSPSEIRESMAAFRWNVDPYEEKSMFVIIDCFNGALGLRTDEKYYVKNPLDVNEQMYVIDRCVNHVIKTFSPDIKVRVAYDSAPLATMGDLATFFRIARRLLSYTKTYNVIGLSPIDRGAQSIILENAILRVVDGIIEFDKRIEDGKLNYYLWIDKMMMTSHSRSVHPYVILDDGIHVMKPKAHEQ